RMPALEPCPLVSERTQSRVIGNMSTPTRRSEIATVHHRQSRTPTSANGRSVGLTRSSALTHEYRSATANTATSQIVGVPYTEIMNDQGKKATSARIEATAHMAGRNEKSIHPVIAIGIAYQATAGRRLNG